MPQNVSKFGQAGSWTAFQAQVVSEAAVSDGKIPQRMMMF